MKIPTSITKATKPNQNNNNYVNKNKPMRMTTITTTIKNAIKITTRITRKTNPIQVLIITRKTCPTK